MHSIVILILIILPAIDCKFDRPDRNQLEEVFYWDILEFKFPPNRREQAIASESYIPNKNGIVSTGVWQDKLFVGVFRFRKGVASSLNYFSINTTKKSPVLIPYPSFDANYVNEDPNNRTLSLPSPSSVINAAHLEIDKCNRLWVADWGYTEHFGHKRIIAPPAIVIFDLTTNTLIRRIEIPHQFSNPLGGLPQIAIDFDGSNCEDVYAYASDFFRSIFVYSFKNDRIWQVEHNFMGSEPHQGHFVFEQSTYLWNYGVYALTVGDKQPDGSKHIYFAPFASTKVYFVSNRILQDENYSLAKYYFDFHLLGETDQNGHSTALIYDEKTGVMFNTMFGAGTIGCWNSHSPYKSFTTVHKMSTNFFPVDIDIDEDRNLWVVSLLVPLLVDKQFELGRRNVRIFKETLEQAITDTNCKLQKSEL